MTWQQFDQWPLLLRAAQLKEAGIPDKALKAMAVPVQKEHDRVPFGKIGYVSLPSSRAKNGYGRRLYRKIDLQRYLNHHL